ncbi:MAG: BCCT family transporter [Pseudomonadota bacterium]
MILQTLKETRPLVIAPPAILLLLALAFSLIDFDGFHAAASTANQWILTRFDWLFSLASFCAVLVLIWVWVSPLGSVRIGGPTAKPILNRWNWFAITLCTTIAIGILFWGAAEPMFHFNGPPDFAGVDARSSGATHFALSAMFMHWTITPYAIYAVPALAFALAHFNLGRPYSLSGPLTLIFGRAATGRGGAIIDAIGLYALVAGVAASLGAGVMTIGGGVSELTGWHDGVWMRLLIASSIVAIFVVSSISGIQRGIKVLSDINIRFFLLLSAFVLIFGPSWPILKAGFGGVVDYAVDFVPHSLSWGARAGDDWTRNWTVFYFANWLAWAPITALFLGRIAVGYTVREFLTFNLVLPAAFGGFWMTIFGGAAIEIDALTSGTLTQALETNGPEAVIYALFDALPLSSVLVVSFVFLSFISFVTAMDSNTHSIASVCFKSSIDSQEVRAAATRVKIFWGALVGAVAFVMTATTGIDGVRMLSNLGGLPGLFILIAMIAVIIAMYIHWREEITAGVQPATAATPPLRPDR